MRADVQLFTNGLYRFTRQFISDHIKYAISPVTKTMVNGEASEATRQYFYKALTKHLTLDTSSNTSLCSREVNMYRNFIDTLIAEGYVEHCVKETVKNDSAHHITLDIPDLHSN